MPLTVAGRLIANLLTEIMDAWRQGKTHSASWKKQLPILNSYKKRILQRIWQRPKGFAAPDCDAAAAGFASALLPRARRARAMEKWFLGS